MNVPTAMAMTTRGAGRGVARPSVDCFVTESAALAGLAAPEKPTGLAALAKVFGAIAFPRRSSPHVVVPSIRLPCIAVSVIVPVVVVVVTARESGVGAAALARPPFVTFSRRERVTLLIMLGIVRRRNPGIITPAVDCYMVRRAPARDTGCRRRPITLDGVFSGLLSRMYCWLLCWVFCRRPGG